MATADAIDAVLPQTQCRRCGHAGCRPYAEAIAEAHAPINRCPPGGAPVIGRLARLTGRPVVPLDPVCGDERPLEIALVDESACIGCTKCIQACPVDAICGAAGWQHTVVPELCTGCGLCVVPCPVDCIDMRPVEPLRSWTRADADAARERHAARAQRLAREREERARRLATRGVRLSIGSAQDVPTQDAPTQDAPTQDAPTRDAPAAGEARKRAIIEAAVQRARLRATGRPAAAR